MKDDRKRMRILKGLAILVIIAILGFVGWYVWHPKNNTNKTNPPSASSSTGNGVNSDECSVAVKSTDNQTSPLPSSWNWYEIKDFGLKYAYPKSWGSVTTQTNTELHNYVASFTVNPSGANTIVTLSPSCSDFQSALSAIGNGKFDVLSGTATTRALRHDQMSYSSLSHWSTNAGNQYKLVTEVIVNIGGIKSVTVGYSLTSGSQICPDDKLASSNQPKCINQSISNEVNELISSLQKI